MIEPTITYLAVAAPLMVALACLFAYRKLAGGRHLLFWTIGHGILAIPFAIVGTADLTDGLALPAALPTGATLVFSAVMITTGIRVLTGHTDRLLHAITIAAGIAGCATAAQLVSPVLKYAAPSIVASAAMLYSGGLLILRGKTALYYATGLLLLVRGSMAILYAVTLVSPQAELNSAFAGSIFTTLLTGLGLMMIEFDNARQSEKTARKSEHETRQFVETLLDAMPATMTYKDRDLRYRMINRAMLDLAGPMQVDLIGRTWSEIIGPETAAAVERQDRRIIETGEPAHMEQVWTRPDGKLGVVFALKVPLKDKTGRVEGIITCGIDISRLKETETQLIEQREAAEAASRAKTSFLANMSHELRTPLNAIIGFAEMLAAGYSGPLTPRQQEYAGNIKESGEHLLRLVNDILDLSRLDGGKLEVHPAPCDFDRIAHAALAMVEPQARQGKVSLSYGPTGLSLLADERALTQILVNLLGNAVKFNRSGGTVALNAATRNGVHYITIADTGMGMSEAEIREAVQPFHRTDVYRARPNSGAGLGLSICRSLVDLHGGRLDIRSRPGHGTTVEIALPA